MKPLVFALACLAVLPLVSCGKKDEPVAEVKTREQFDAEIKAAEKDLEKAKEQYRRAAARYDSATTNSSHDVFKKTHAETGEKLNAADDKVRQLIAEKKALYPR